MSIRFLVVIVSSIGLAACDAGPPGPDGSLVRDAALVDAGGLLDAGAPVADAGAADAGPAVACDLTPCDPRSPDGCAEGRCVLWGESASCEPAVGSYAMGAACTSVRDCAPGLACFSTAEGGVCGRVCCPGDTAAACTDGALCGGSGELVDGSHATFGRCLPPRSCSVLRPDATCEDREGCYIVDADTTECRVAGTAGVGEACAAPEDCQAGFFCGGIGTTRRCVRICRLGAGDCPAEEGRCIAQAHSPEGTGFCTMDSTANSRG